MSHNKIHRIKNNGIFYTPANIADLLAERAINKRGISIFDPACGKGSLLKAAIKRCAKLPIGQKPYLAGCDRFIQRDLEKNINFIRSDFFTFKTNKKFDLILTNPPYVQAGRIAETVRTRYCKRYARPLGLSANLDLWVYFLIKCATHLKKGGAIAAILPWSFLETDYAQGIRKWISENFGSIQVLVLKGAHFKNTVKRVLLVWLQEYGANTRGIRLGYADECDSERYFQDVPIQMWNSENIMAGLNPGATNLMSRLQEAGFKSFEEYADVSIGIVTGANEFFVRSKADAATRGFSEKSVLRILTSVKDLHQVIDSGLSDKVLLQFNRMTEKKDKYVRKGQRLGLHKRVHCLRRKEQTGLWYTVNPGPVPDAFFTYRVSIVPYLVQNPDSFQCTNALHKVLFNRACKTEQRWIQLSLLSLFSQFSLEVSGRHYGNGIIKIEPKALKKSLVYASKKRIPDKVYNNILQPLRKRDKDEACLRATRFVAKAADIDDGLAKDVLTSLNWSRALRGAPMLRIE